MAINKKLIHFRTKAAFTTELNAGNIPDTSIVFIKDTKEIWTHGQLYSCSLTEVDTELSDTSVNPVQNKAVKAGITAAKNEMTSQLTYKVDKVTGKGLSTNDYTTQEKKDLADLKSGKANNTLYRLPDAADGVTGGIQIGYAASGRNYALKLLNKKAYVVVPWTDQNVYQAVVPESSTTAYPILGSAEKSLTDGKAAQSVYLKDLTFTPEGKVLSVGTGTMEAKRFKGTADTATSAAAARKATQDGNGKNIADTYQTKADFNNFKTDVVLIEYIGQPDMVAPLDTNSRVPRENLPVMGAVQEFRMGVASTLVSQSTTEWDYIVFDTSRQRFVAYGTDGKYYGNWTDSADYVSAQSTMKPRADRLFVCNSNGKFYRYYGGSLVECCMPITYSPWVKQAKIKDNSSTHTFGGIVVDSTGIGSDGAVMEVYKGETVGDLTKWRMRIYNFVDTPLKIGRIPKNGSTDDSYYIQSYRPVADKMNMVEFWAESTDIKITVKKL